MRMAVMRLTDTVSWRTTWVQHPKHTERWQSQWGVPLPHSYALSHSSLPHPWVSHTGSTSRAPLGIAWHIHCPRGFKALQLKVQLKIQKYISQSDNKSGSVQSTGLGGTQASEDVADWGSKLSGKKSIFRLTLSPREPHAVENRS